MYQFIEMIGVPKRLYHKIGLIMRLTTVIMIACLMQVSAAGLAQKITLNERNASLTNVLRTIGKQSGFDVFFDGKSLPKTQKVTVVVNNAAVEEALDQALKGLNYTYKIDGNTIAIKPKEEKGFLDRIIERFQAIDVTGRIVDEKGNPIAGATIRVKQTGVATSSNETGFFTLRNVDEKAMLEISYLGYQTKEVKAAVDLGAIRLEIEVGKLEEITVNAGYYRVKEREATGSISRVTAKDIAQQPVANPLAAMQGRMAGVHITQSSGTPGGGFDVQIRGSNSLRTEGNAPLYIVDGVPFPSQSSSDASLSSGIFPAGNTSPLNTINPNDIESIEVLKDADATAIYGSRGSNGVVLITTKKASGDKTAFSLQSATSISTVAGYMDLMNSQQYLQMRRDAYENDGIKFPANAFDVNGTWDTDRFTDWQKEFIGGKALTQNTQFSVSGGSGKTSYLISGSDRREATVFPGNFNYGRTNIMLNVNHTSQDNRFDIQANIQKSKQRNRLMAYDFSSEMYLAPNAPDLYDLSGNLNWEDNTFQNPMVKLNALYVSKTNDFNGRLGMSYKLYPNLKFSISTGFTYTDAEEFQTQPSSMYNPAFGVTSEWSFMGSSTVKRSSWIAEPQLTWNKTTDKGRWNALVGATVEERSMWSLGIQASNFTSDDFIFNASNAAVQQIVRDAETVYRYAAAYARVNYTHDEKYIVNLTGRRDGSSRFGPNNRFANFGAIGATWLFSREKFFNESRWLSFGKLRASYGVAGSDLIGDYQYLNTFGIGTQRYDGVVGLEPLRLYNPDFSWESNKKLEAALELEFFNGRLASSFAWYRNTSSNQLVGIPLPGTTGFTTVQANLGATVENSGWEFTLRGAVLDKKDFKWSMDVNLTLPRNRLVSFPGLEESSYANRYEIGKPVTVRRLYQYVGVNKETGLYEVEDVNGDGILDVHDRKVSINTAPTLFGGLHNRLDYKSWSLDFNWQFVKQKGLTADYYSNYLGGMHNQPAFTSDYWTPNNTDAAYQRPTAGNNAAALQANQLYKSSTGVITRISFIRLKNIQLQYMISAPWLGKANASVYLQAQNFITITPYRGNDPESSGYYLPVMKTCALGLYLRF